MAITRISTRTHRDLSLIHIYIQTGHPNVRVLVMSGLPEQQYAVNVLRAGASGYLSKDSAPEELMKAVRTVLAGRRYVSAALAEILVADLDGDPDKPLHACLLYTSRCV